MGVPVRGDAILLSTLLLAGCTRSWYRQQADKDAYTLETGHIPSAASDIGRIDITPPPTSRLSNPYDPDKPPKPPDDPAAAFFMARPGGMKGYSHWTKFGEAPAIEPPTWEQALGLEDRGTLKLTQDKSVEIALLDSREYQSALEDVYLQALNLSLNRFEFECQWFGRTSTNYVRTGAGSLPLESNLLTTTADIGFTRNLAAGGQIMVDFANAFVWEFTGRSRSVTGAFSASLFQPLLRGFGRNVRLELLTQSERDTLYAVRDFARFRKSFWADIAISGNGGNGYLDLLLLVQNIRNAKENIKSQEENYRLNLEYYRGNKRSVVEVDQALQGLLSARKQLLDSEISLENALDNFKRRLGLPPRMPAEIDDSGLRQFVLIEPEVETLRDELSAFDLARKAELGTLPDAPTLAANFEVLAKLVERTLPSVASTERELVRWKATLDKPVAAVDAETRIRALENYQSNAEVPAEAKRELDTLQERVAKHRAAVSPATREASWTAQTDDVKRLFATLDELINATTIARIYSIELPAVEQTEGDAIQFAKDNRLDFQNVQARVTDAWRRVDVAANALRGDLNLTLGTSQISQPGSLNPFNISSDASIYRVGVQFDGPLNRFAARNVYRASQIAYERARRDFMAASDDIELQIRFNLRSITQARVSFEIARQRLIAAARQVENERILLVAPVPPRGGNTGDAALRTLNALAQLNAARNDLAAEYFRFEQQRIQLLLNLEALQLDDRGFPVNAAPRRPVETPPSPIP